MGGGRFICDFLPHVQSPHVNYTDLKWADITEGASYLHVGVGVGRPKALRRPLTSHSDTMLDLSERFE